MGSLTRDELASVLRYDIESGEFIRLKRAGGPQRSDGTCGNVNHHGYRVISVKGRVYQAHRLAWLWVYGVFPKKHIDHIDRDKLNNRICNLRQADDSENGQNVSVVRASSGVRGVSWNKSVGKWQAQIKVKGKSLYLGCFDTIAAAARVRAGAELEFHPFSPRNSP